MRSWEVFVLIALIFGCYSTVRGDYCTLDNPLEQYPGCFCFYEWNDANHVGNWSSGYPDYWLQLDEPALVSFVSIAGDNTIHVLENVQVNEVYVGPNRWDTTRLVIDEGYSLTILYDDYPVIFAVEAERLVTGATFISITGKGFGFNSEAIAVTVFDSFDVLEGVEYIGSDFAYTYSCQNVQLKYRDARIECYISAYNILPSTFSVTVSANGYVSEPAYLDYYYK